MINRGQTTPEVVFLPGDKLPQRSYFSSQIEKYLGKPINELFLSFDDTPLGSASVAQVHKAELFDGTTVAVKVRREGVVETVARDFALIEKILDKFVKDDKGGTDIKAIIKELEKTSKTELDFTNEANNLDRFMEYNKDREGVESPKCYREFTCEAVLTEDFVSGNEVSDTAFLDTLDEAERERIAELIADNFASQVLVDGFLLWKKRPAVVSTAGRLLDLYMQ